jgi:hypothetical protein
VGHSPNPNPAQAAKVATMAMGRRPRRAHPHEPTQGPLRALAAFRRLQPTLAARWGDPALLAVAQPPPAGRCRWDLARLLATRHQQPAPRWTADNRALLGPACSPGCRAQVLPRPPKAKPKPAATSSTTSARARHPSAAARLPLPASDPAHLAHLERYEATIAAAAVMPPDRARYNATALRRMGMDPAGWPHLTQASS